VLLPILFTICALNLHPLDLGVMSLDRACTLDNKPITVPPIVAKPAYTLLGRTMVGAADRDDDVERGAVQLGKQFENAYWCWARGGYDRGGQTPPSSRVALQTSLLCFAVGEEQRNSKQGDQNTHKPSQG